MSFRIASNAVSGPASSGTTYRDRTEASGHAARTRRATTASRRQPRSRAGGPSKELAGLEQRIADVERRLKALEERLAEVARSGNYMETRRVGEEHASLEAALRSLYDEWAARSE